MRKQISLLAALAVCGGWAGAQAPAGNKFDLHIGKSISGVEEFSVQQGPAGHSFSCKSTLTVPGSSSEIVETASFTADWSPLRYKSQATSSGVTQVAEAWLDGQKFKMRASGGAKSTERSIPSYPRSILVDSMSACLAQAALN